MLDSAPKTRLTEEVLEFSLFQRATSCRAFSPTFFLVSSGSAPKKAKAVGMSKTQQLLGEYFLDPSTTVMQKKCSSKGSSSLRKKLQTLLLVIKLFFFGFGLFSIGASSNFLGRLT